MELNLSNERWKRTPSIMTGPSWKVMPSHGQFQGQVPGHFVASGVRVNVALFVDDEVLVDRVSGGLAGKVRAGSRKWSAR